VAAIRVAAFDEAHVANEGLERLALAIDPHSPDPNLRPRLAGDEKGDVGAGCSLWRIRNLRPSLDLGERIAVSRVEIEDHAAGLVLETVDPRGSLEVGERALDLGALDRFDLSELDPREDVLRPLLDADRKER